VLSDGGTYLCNDQMSGPPDSYTGQAELIVIGILLLPVSRLILSLVDLQSLG